jgi:hypothetical protein
MESGTFFPLNDVHSLQSVEQQVSVSKDWIKILLCMNLAMKKDGELEM